MMNPQYSRLIASGSALPSHHVSNAEMVERLAKQGIETSDEWIRSRSGIEARYFADTGVLTSDLATQAAHTALTQAQLSVEQIDLIIVATSTPDHMGSFPSTACIVQHKLGMKNGAPAFDVQAVCSGFVYALTVADALIKAGSARRALVIGAETFSRILDFSDRSTCVLFGDGAAAVILEASERPGLRASALHADGQHHDILCVPGSLTKGQLNGSGFVYMEGQAVFKLAVDVLSKVANEVLLKASCTIADIDWLVPHQANIRIMESTAKKLGIAPEKVIRTVAVHGNTSAASIPLALDAGRRDGRIQEDHTILIEGVGGGFTWGAAILTL